MAVIPNGAQFLNNVIGLSSATVTSDPLRNAMVMTSRLRQIDLTSSERGAFDGALVPTDVRSFGDDATNFLAGIQGVQRDVILGLNATRIVFDMPKRTIEKPTRGGTIVYHCTNKPGQNNDLLTLTLEGNSGNIDTSSVSITDEQRAEAEVLGIPQPQVDQETGATANLLAFQNLLLLTMEPVLLPDMTENMVTISLATPVMPQSIDFYGSFKTALRFEMSAEDPNSQDWSVDFRVMSTNPPLEQVLSDTFRLLQRANAIPDPSGTRTGTNVEISNP